MNFHHERIIWIVICGFLLGFLINKNLSFEKSKVEPTPSKNEENEEFAPKFLENFNSKERDKILSYYSLMNKSLDYLKGYYNYQDKLDLEKLFFGALEGLYDNADDPYTSFLDPSFFKEVSDDIEGSVGGIGVYLKENYGHVSILSVISNSPAYKAGIRAHDIIEKINDHSIENDSLDTVVSALSGKIDSSVTVSVYRPSLEQKLKFKLIRKKVLIDSVYSTILYPHTGYLAISQFSLNSDKEVKTHLLKLLSKHINSLIIDVRNNPGGSLESAVNIANFFIKKGLLVYTKGINESENHSYYAKDYKLLFPEKYPLAILINKNSASAAEILSGTLKDHHRATVIGEKSFGKGSVQDIFPFQFGKKEIAFKITVAKYYTPKGYTISKHGITPDIKIKDLSISPLNQVKIQYILKNNSLSLLGKNFNKATTSQASFNKLKQSLRQKGTLIPDMLLKKLIFEQSEIQLGHIHFINPLYDPQLKKAISFIQKNS